MFLMRPFLYCSPLDHIQHLSDTHVSAQTIRVPTYFVTLITDSMLWEAPYILCNTAAQSESSWILSWKAKTGNCASNYCIPVPLTCSLFFGKEELVKHYKANGTHKALPAFQISCYQPTVATLEKEGSLVWFRFWERTNMERIPANRLELYMCSSLDFPLLCHIP